MKKPSRKIINFLKTLKLVSAEWYGKPFEPLPWFKEVIHGIYDNLDENGYRKVREAYIQIPRKNAKSMSVSGLALYHLLLDGERDGQIYIVASDRSNASVIFKMLTSMIGQNKVLSKVCKIVPSRKEVYCALTDSTIKAMSSDVENKHGLSPSLVIYDELHTAKNRELYDVMQTGMGARRQPLMIAITTAGADTSSFCYEQYSYAKSWLAGTVIDDGFYAYIKEVSSDEDWKNPVNWKKANPSWGITVKPEYIEDQFKKALSQMSAQNNFRRLYLNQWVEQSDRWLSMEEWEACKIESADTTGLECWCGLDLSSNEDMSAFVQVFKLNERLFIKPHFFLPRDTIEGHTHKRIYKQWESGGFLNIIDGNIVDHDYVAEYIFQLNEKNPISAIAYDPFMSSQILMKLQEHGLNTIQYNQSYRVLSPASKDFERDLRSQKIAHDGHPVLTWNANNVTVKEDMQENIKPVKPSMYAKIDGIVAAIMACDLARRMDTTKSIYETKDLIVL